MGMVVRKKKTNGLTVRRVALAGLHPDPTNARKHGKRNLETIRGSLKRFGQVEPLVVQKGTGRIIGGNGRFEAMLAEGWTHAEVVEIDVGGKAVTALGLALNRTAELAEWDLDALGLLVPELDAELLGDIGFDAGDLGRLLLMPDIELGTGEIAEKPAMRRLAVFVPRDDPKIKKAIDELARLSGGHVAECSDENCNISVRDLDPNTWARRRVQLGAQTSSGRKTRGSESQDGKGG